jgi:shikimate kinase
MKIIFIGYRGTGKSTIGKLLAVKLQIPFWDTDSLVEEELGMPIKDIIDLQGWDFFRTREKETIQRLSRKNDGVIATGGGAVLLPENVVLMKQMGKVVWLNASLHDIIERIKNDIRSEATRPRFTEANIVQETIAVLKQRIPLYEKAADFSIDTTGQSAGQAAEEVYRKIAGKGFRQN